MAIFSRMGPLASGHILEDTDMYNRYHEMFAIFSSTDNRENDYGDGLCFQNCRIIV